MQQDVVQQDVELINANPHLVGILKLTNKTCKHIQSRLHVVILKSEKLLLLKKRIGMKSLSYGYSIFAIHGHFCINLCYCINGIGVSCVFKLSRDNC